MPTNGGIIITDSEDIWILAKGWNVGGPGYAMGLTSEGMRHVYLHRVLANPPEAMIVDHANSNKIDNRRANLRVCSLYQNNANKRRKNRSSTKYKGICKTPSGTWYAQITFHRKHHALGTFANEIDAARAYDAAAKKFFGEFARTNFSEAA